VAETRIFVDVDTTLRSGLDSADNMRLRNNCLVIIPTYNEIGNLESLVRKVLALGTFDVLVVDDHSPDGTGKAADELARLFPGRVTALHRSGKQGLGSAYMLGFTYALRASYARIFQMDADFSHDPGCLPALRDSLNGADVVVGSRYAPGGSTQHWPLRRRVLSRAGSVYAALVLGLSLHDVTSGFKGFTRQVLESLDFAAIRSTGYSFQIEVTYRCFEQGFHIVEVPILFEDRRLGQSKMSGHIIMEAFVMVWRLRFGQLRYRRMLPWSSSSGTTQ
jgi:dolichol-phosphate mannosyltransferase